MAITLFAVKSKLEKGGFIFFKISRSLYISILKTYKGIGTAAAKCFLLVAIFCNFSALCLHVLLVKGLVFGSVSGLSRRWRRIQHHNLSHIVVHNFVIR